VLPESQSLAFSGLEIPSGNHLGYLLENYEFFRHEDEEIHGQVLPQVLLCVLVLIQLRLEQLAIYLDEA